jgi:hypothetical protein
MPDRMRELFAQLRKAYVPVASPGRVAARGRRLRLRARLQISAAAVAIIAGTALVVHLVADPGGRGRPADISFSPRSTRPTPTRTTPPPHTVLPPTGNGLLILGLNASDQFVMARTGSDGPAAPVPGLSAVGGGPSDIATDPAGGWVVTYWVTPQAPYGSRAARLAVVTANGRSYDFGPVFSGKAVTAVAVSPDGSRVAVALCPTSGSPLSGSGKATIEVLPTPGHSGGRRTWTIPAPSNWVDDLSWAPDGEHLTYAVGFQTGGGIDGYPITLDIAAPGTVAPVQSGWPRAGKGAPTTAGKAACPPNVGAWLGPTGQFAALEECDRSRTEVVQPADASDGAAAGPAITIPGARPGCLGAALDPAPAGNPILITYCGIYLDDHGRITKLPGGLTAAALAG